MTLSSPLSGAASFSTSKLSIGTHSISVSYAGNSVFGEAVSTAQIVTINDYTATVGLTASPSTALPNTAVTLNASVAASAGSDVPTGSVSFMDGKTLLSKVTLAAGKANLTTSSLAVGSHTITAVYSGDTNFATVTSSAQTVVIRVAAATTTSLGSSNASSDEDASVTLTATISSSVSGTITGTVTFYDGTTSLGTGAVTSGAATFTTSSLSVGTHSITARFGGDMLYLASTSAALSQEVAAPSISFAANPTSLTIAKGASGTVVITARPVGGGYAGNVSFACGTLPADASCSFTPASLTFTSASGAQTSTLTFSTKLATSAAITHGLGKSYAPEIFAALLLLPLGFRRRLRKVAATAGSATSTISRRLWCSKVLAVRNRERQVTRKNSDSAASVPETASLMMLNADLSHGNSEAIRYKPEMSTLRQVQSSVVENRPMRSSTLLRIIAGIGL
jgi:hypothetical protein